MARLNEPLTLTRVGEHMDGSLYQDEQGRYYVDGCHKIEHGQEGTVYILCPRKDPDGEPDHSLTGIIYLTNPPTERELREKAYKLDYMLLDRDRQGVKYYSNMLKKYRHQLTCPEEVVTKLKELIASMKERWQRIPEDLKPEWLTWEQVLGLEKEALSGE